MSGPAEKQGEGAGDAGLVVELMEWATEARTFTAKEA